MERKVSVGLGPFERETVGDSVGRGTQRPTGLNAISLDCLVSRSRFLPR